MASELVPSSGVEKSVVKGGEGGTPWASGYKHDGWTRLYVARGTHGIEAIEFFAAHSREHFQRRTDRDLLLDMKDDEEYLVSVEGWYDTSDTESSNIIKGLIFKTNKGVFHPIIGKTIQDGDKRFTLEAQGKKIIGFHGFSRNRDSPTDEYINSIGAYFIPIDSTTPPPPEIKLEGYGYVGDASWNDGYFDGVKKVSVGQAEIGIGAVKFVYHRGGQDVERGEYGKRTAMGYEHFVLDYPSEYITAVEGTYDKIFGSTFEVITMLRFVTNKRTSDPFGLEAGKPFTLKEEGYKIVGFHGMAENLLHQIGVNAVPIPIPIIPIPTTK